MSEPQADAGVARGALLPWLLGALALVLRLQGITFGLDFDDVQGAVLNNNIDERGMVEAVQENLLHGNLDPGSFVFRGPAGFLLFGVADLALVSVLGWRHEGGFAAARQALEANPCLLFLSHRCVAALAGALTVVLLVRIVRREFGARCALAAGLFLATAYAHARESHYGAVDVVWTLFGLLALDAMLRWQRAPDAARALRVGGLCGLAFAVKYHALFLGLPLLLSCWNVARSSGGGWRAFLGRASLAGAGALGAFLLLYPGLFVAPEAARSIVAFQLETNTAVAAQAKPLGSLLFHLRHSLGTGLGEPVFLLFVAGLFLAWKRGPAARWYALSFLFLAPILFATTAHPVRYAMGVFPLCALLAGLAFERLLGARPAWLQVAVLVVSCAPSLVRVVTLNRLLPRRDTRVEMLEVLRARKLPPEEVFAFGTHHGLPTPPKRSERLYTSYMNLALAGNLERGNLRLDANFEVRLERLLAQPPRLILWDLSRADLDLPGKDRLEGLVQSRYREVLRLDGRITPFAIPELKDGGSVHMIPFTRPWTMSRPGAPLVLYERVD